MRFGPVSLEESEGQILAQNVSDENGRRILRKGRPLDPPALKLLKELGYETVFVAHLDEGDVHENEAAERIARITAGKGVERSAAHVGRVNVTATELGVVRVDVESLLHLNETGGVTVATLPTHAVVRPGERVATVKVIPYAIPQESVANAEALSVSEGIVSVRAIDRQAVAIVLVGGSGAWAVLGEGLGDSIRERIEALGCFISEVTFTHTDEESLSDALQRQVTQEVGMIVVAGETAIMDLNDVIPRGLRLAGGRVEQLGLPMDPGQLLLLGYLHETPVVGAPGCVRGTSPDGFDSVVPRLLAGERLAGIDLRELGHGGLLSDPRRG